MAVCPTHSSEEALRASFARIGVGAGKTIDFATFSPEMKAALVSGMAAGQKEIEAHRAATAGDINNLLVRRVSAQRLRCPRYRSADGDRADFKEEAIYPLFEKDSGGQALDGSKGRYTLRFAKGQFPPVNAFWSLTMYDLPQQLLV